jgi:MFS family permease
VNFIFYYGTSYFTSSGIKNSFVVSMITSAVNVGSTFPGLYMVEKWGRRPLLLFGAAGMAVCQFIVAGVGTGASSNNISAQQALIAFVCIYIFFFACSWGPCSTGPLPTLLRISSTLGLEMRVWNPRSSSCGDLSVLSAFSSVRMPLYRFQVVTDT